MAWSTVDKAYKILVNKRATSILKQPYEEFGDNTLDLHASEIRAEPIPFNDPTQAIADSVAELRTLFTLTLDNTVGSNQSYFAFSTPDRLKNWIPDKYGALYAIKLYDNAGSQIFPTDPSGWVFDYPTGILIFNGSTAAFAKPFKITGYRYIGTFMDTFAGGGKLKKNIIPIGVDGTTAFDLAVLMSEPFSEIFEVKVNGLPLRSVEWTLLANILTFVEIAAGFSLATTDELEVHYYAA